MKNTLREIYETIFTQVCREYKSSFTFTIMAKKKKARKAAKKTTKKAAKKRRKTAKRA